MNNKKYLIVFNPVANRVRKSLLSQLIQRLKQQNMTWQLYPTEPSMSANRHFFRQNIEDYTDVIVVGGDGTLHNVINCLGVNSHIRMGLLPAGTGNDFAKWLYGRHRQNLEIVLSTVTGEQTVEMTVGQCQFNDGSKRLFHNVLGLGLDAVLAKKLTQQKGIWGKLGYLVAALRTIPFYRAQDITIKEPSQSLTYANLITAFANAPYFGAGMKIAPTADAMANSLALCRIDMLPRLTMFQQLFRLFNGSHIEQPYTDYRMLNDAVLIESEGLDIEADGEYIGQSPCSISSISNAIKIKKPT
ncbi:MAG: YegS/Rv2252/BmrU family lipid kinase [Gammaproteobacteria bacterium]|nr:YegS/Rv2252/BmrU family lipid kinase [Gammaproteobacteria bacterium]